MKVNLPFNWFDLFVVAMLVFGYARGRKNGLSQEMLPFIKWIVLVVVSAIAYQPLGVMIADNLKLGKLLSFVLAYAFVAGAIFLVFVILGQTVGERLKGTDKFGKAEFYLAMPAGMVRFACIVLALLAVLNARFYSTAEVNAMTKFQNDNYGSNFFPTLPSIQDDVFKGSFVGKHVKEHLGFLLIKPTPAKQPVTLPVVSNPKRKGVAR
jgi:hypothetical protein